MLNQTALIVSEVGGRVKSTSDWPIPRPGHKQVQIRVTVAGLNPHDQKARDIGLFIKDSLPAILGHDITGVVADVGPGVTKFKTGDKIVSQSQLVGHHQKALQQYAIVDEDFSSKIPKGFNDHDAATLPTNAVAALISLFDPSGLDIPAPWRKTDVSFDYSGATLLILGGGSNCGRFGVQFAQMAGIGKIVVVGGSEEELKRWGATHVLDRHGGDEAVIKRVRDVVGDDLVYAFDAINPPDGQHLAISALSSSKTGKVARLRFSSGAIDESKIVGEKKAGYEMRNVLGLSHMKPNTAKPFWDRVEEYLRNESLVPLKYEVVDGLNVEKVNGVLDRYRDGKKVTQTHFKVSE
ncbi:GroES-like protein [Macroventuria anomochaeta]|uniref:GroES-like protein n=1 Tax=Macroventuria anomochaeta TaxID=301207 RepID=A0ACB6S9S2_9PLEO|nr:GroES-like protein [Macroventuria anomochaeta]KAF2629857.1 GroES-like protein [Macroventuria anomochaeta]